jgi:hypothetical protein
MTEQTPAVTSSHPPERLLRAVNPALRALLRTPLAGSARRQFMVLNFRGRKSGRQFSIPVSAHRIDNDLYALVFAGWKNNFRDGGIPTLEDFTEAAQREGMTVIRFTPAG